MTRLGLTLNPSEFETATSWASRLAARNGVTHVQYFTEDLGLNWKRVVGGDQEVITELCDLANTDPTRVLRYAKRTQSGGQTSLGSVPVGPKFCRNNLMSICPRCVQEWYKDGGQLLAGAPFWWQLTAVRSCRLHGIPLVELPNPEGIRNKYDFAGRVRDNIATINRAAEDAVVVPKSDFELYIISRFSAAHEMRGGWLDDMEILTVANVCQTLGLTLINKGRQFASSQMPGDLAQAAEAGFQALRDGPEEMFRHMRVAQDGPAGGGMGFMRDFKPFHRYLHRMELTEGSSRLQDSVRRYVIENYPTGEDEPVLNQLAGCRFLHSPLSASLRVNVSRARLVKALTVIRETGAFPHLPRPTKHLWIPCREWDPWLAEYSETLIFKKAARFVGASAATLQKSVVEGWVTPFVDFPRQVPRFHPTELTRFLNRMLSGSREVDVVTKSMVRIDQAPVFCTLPLIELLRFIWDGRLRKIYTEAGRFGLRSVILDREEILQLIEQPATDDLLVEDARRKLHVSSQTMALIIRSGMIEVFRTLHPRTRQRTTYISLAAIEEFFQKYETLGRLGYFEHVQAKSVQARLNRLKIDPLPLPSPHSKIYRREDLAPYLG